MLILRSRASRVLPNNQPVPKGATYGVGAELGGWIGLQTQKAVVPYADGKLIVLPGSQWAEESSRTLHCCSQMFYQLSIRVLNESPPTTSGVCVSPGAGAIGLVVAYLLAKLWQKRVILTHPHDAWCAEAGRAGFETVDPIGTTLDEDFLQHIGLPEGFDAAVDRVGQTASNLIDQVMPLFSPYSYLSIIGVTRVLALGLTSTHRAIHGSVACSQRTCKSLVASHQPGQFRYSYCNSSLTVT